MTHCRNRGLDYRAANYAVDLADDRNPARLYRAHCSVVDRDGNVIASEPGRCSPTGLRKAETLNVSESEPLSETDRKVGKR